MAQWSDTSPVCMRPQTHPWHSTSVNKAVCHGRGPACLGSRVPAHLVVTRAAISSEQCLVVFFPPIFIKSFLAKN